jgi:hypothetical protein
MPNRCAFIIAISILTKTTGGHGYLTLSISRTATDNPLLVKAPPSTLRMTYVEGTSDAQPATSNGSATIPDTRDEKASPRSEAGIERINPSDYDEWSSVHT